ncbi:hypothetical protein ASE52_09430 [Acidovorax sp. Root275]|nr:hypothetical protein ASE39_21130 [Acidovorax sp. Root267]KRD49208.1 hypothetical protein ASE52_09430 [Acidovorax sp. Root275]
MRLVPSAFLCRAVLAAVPLAVLLPGCGGTAPTVPAARTPAGSWASPAAPATAAKAVNPWAGLQAQVGRQPADGGDYLRTGPLADRLRGLLGPTNYPVLLDNMGVSSPLRQEGALLYITGNRLHEGGTEAAAVVIHPAADAVRVWLLTGGEEWDVQDRGTPKTLPADVATMMENARR